MKINGSLVFDASGNSRIENLRVESVSVVPEHASSAGNVGRLLYVSSETGGYAAGTFLYGGATGWVQIATGGNAAALQTEVDAIETSLGAGINSNGTFNAAAFTGFTNVTTPTDITNVLSQLDSALNANNELSELNDVTLTSATANDLLQYSGTAWVNKAIGTASGVQGYDAALASIAALNPTGGQMLYTTDNDTFAATPVTTFGRSLLDDADATAGRQTLGVVIGTDVQAYDAELAALAGVTSAADKLPYFTGAGTADVTTMTSFARSLLDDADATAARTTLNAQAADGTLSAIADLTGGIVVVDTTGGSAYARELVAPAQGFTITNPNGVSGNPTFVLANDLNALESLSTTGIIVRTADGAAATRSVVAPAAGITVTNADGVAGDVTLALANDLSALEGLSTTGMIVRTGDGTATTRSIGGQAGRIVVSNGDGVASNPDIDLATVTQATGGSFLKVTIDSYGRVTQNDAVTTSDITALVDATYVNVAGDTMTGTLNMGGNALTGLTGPVAGNDAATKNYVDNVAAGLSWQAPVNSVGTALPVTATTGDRFLNTTDGKIYTATGTNTWDAGVSPADGWALFDKTDETGFVYSGTAWVQFTGGGQLTAGIGLVKTGNILDVNLGAGIAELPSDEVGIDLFAPTGGALVLTVDGAAASTDTGAKLHLKLDAAGALEQDGNGLRVKANSVTNDMIVNETHTLNADSGNGSIALGGTLLVSGTSAQGIDTSVSGSTFTVTAKDASSSQKGVASFDATQFSVSAGNVTLGTVPIANLASNDITFAASSGSAGAIDLGATLTIAGNGAISTTATTGSVFINVATSTTAGTVGVAAFDGGDFAINESGVVSVKAGGIGNGQLENSVITVAGTSGTDPVALGETLTFSSTVSGLVSSSVTANGVALDVRLASTTETGVASFDSAHFSVTAGAVSLAASLDDLTNVSSADAAATDSILVKTAGDWQAASPATVGGTINLGDLKDVGSATATAGYVLAGDGTNWQAKKIHHVHTQSGAATTWNVTHDLGVRYCNVTVVDDTHNVVIPQSVVFGSTTGLTVTFNTAISGFVAVTGIA